MIAALREALPAFARRVRGYDHPDAVLTGVETRTSSPVRIPRDLALESVNVRGLFPLARALAMPVAFFRLGSMGSALRKR
jgi:uncharacterized FAD-dependent dehydrogenase